MFSGLRAAILCFGKFCFLPAKAETACHRTEPMSLQPRMGQSLCLCGHTQGQSLRPTVWSASISGLPRCPPFVAVSSCWDYLITCYQMLYHWKWERTQFSFSLLQNLPVSVCSLPKLCKYTVAMFVTTWESETKGLLPIPIVTALFLSALFYPPHGHICAWLSLVSFCIHRDVSLPALSSLWRAALLPPTAWKTH